MASFLFYRLSNVSWALLSLAVLSVSGCIVFAGAALSICTRVLCRSRRHFFVATAVKLSERHPYRKEEAWVPVLARVPYMTVYQICPDPCFQVVVRRSARAPCTKCGLSYSGTKLRESLCTFSSCKNAPRSLRSSSEGSLLKRVIMSSRCVREWVYGLWHVK